jgi:hypothetical protein
MRPSIIVLVSLMTITACAGDDDASTTTSVPATTDTAGDDADDQRFPDVVDAAARSDGDAWSFEVTVSSPYDTPERYADAWRVVAPDGTVLGVRELLHDHANEQPFTRSLTGVEIPDDVATVTVEGRDSEYGWGGDTVTVTLVVGTTEP